MPYPSRRGHREVGHPMTTDAPDHIPPLLRQGDEVDRLRAELDSARKGTKELALKYLESETESDALRADLADARALVRDHESAVEQSAAAMEGMRAERDKAVEMAREFNEARVIATRERDALKAALQGLFDDVFVWMQDDDEPETYGATVLQPAAGGFTFVAGEFCDEDVVVIKRAREALARIKETPPRVTGCGEGFVHYIVNASPYETACGERGRVTLGRDSVTCPVCLDRIPPPPDAGTEPE